MNNRLSQEELAQIIAEVERLSQYRETELDQEQVKEILQELGLSPELLEDAVLQIRRKRALEEQQQRRRWIAIAIVAVVFAAIITTTLFIQKREQAYSRITTYQSRITLAQDNGENLSIIERQQTPQVYYRVTLSHAPIGEKLSLRCNWIDPTNKVAHQNRYSTRKLEQEVWTTYCYYQFNQGTTPGKWQVQMLLGNRILSSSSFRVQ